MNKSNSLLKIKFDNFISSLKDILIPGFEVIDHMMKIKNAALEKEKYDLLLKMVPDPWTIKKCGEDSKHVFLNIYNDIAEIIDDYVITGYISKEDLKKLNDFKEMAIYLIKIRINEILNSNEKVDNIENGLYKCLTISIINPSAQKLKLLIEKLKWNDI